MTSPSFFSKFIPTWLIEIANENMAIVCLRHLGWSNAYSINWSDADTVIKPSIRIQHLDSSRAVRSGSRKPALSHIQKLTLRVMLQSYITLLFKAPWYLWNALWYEKENRQSSGGRDEGRKQWRKGRKKKRTEGTGKGEVEIRERSRRKKRREKQRQAAVPPTTGLNSVFKIALFYMTTPSHLKSTHLLIHTMFTLKATLEHIHYICLKSKESASELLQPTG